MADEDQKKQDALAAAQSWLALVDNGDYGEAWEQAAALMKDAVGKDALAEGLRTARIPFGALKTRTPSSMTYATSLPGAPDGEFVVIETEASFEHKEHAGETVTPMMEADGTWRVSGYFLR